MVDAVIMKILSSIYDASFIRNSFGFRPKRSAHQAIVASYRALKKGERPYVVEVDFSNFFNTIPHEKLLEVLRGRVADDAIFLFKEKHRSEQFLRDFKNRVECHGLIVNEEKSRSLSFKKTQGGVSKTSVNSSRSRRRNKSS